MAEALKDNRSVAVIDLVIRKLSGSINIFSKQHYMPMDRFWSSVWCCFLQGGNNIHSRGIAAVAQVFKDNQIITSVSTLSSIIHFIVYSMDCILSNPIHHQFGFQLGVAYNPIGPEGAQALCEILKFHGKIQTLELGWCQVNISDVQMKLFSFIRSKQYNT